MTEGAVRCRAGTQPLRMEPRSEATASGFALFRLSQYGRKEEPIVPVTQ